MTPEIVAPIPADVPLPKLHYPVPFMASNSNQAMETPGASVTGAKPLPDATPTMPVEKLIESMQPEQPLVIDSSMTPVVTHRAGELRLELQVPSAPQ